VIFLPLRRKRPGGGDVAHLTWLTSYGGTPILRPNAEYVATAGRRTRKYGGMLASVNVD